MERSDGALRFCPQPKAHADFEADPLGQMDRRLRFAPIGVKAGIAELNGIGRELIESSPEGGKACSQGPIMGDQALQQRQEFVNSRHDETEFLKQCLEVLLSRLLAVKTDFVMSGRAELCQAVGDAEIAFGLADPSGRQLFHVKPFLWPRSRARTNRLLPAANLDSPESG